MTLIMKEAARAGDALAVDLDMGIRPMKNDNDAFVGFAAADLMCGQYAELVQNETARDNLRCAWLRYSAARHL